MLSVRIIIDNLLNQHIKILLYLFEISHVYEVMPSFDQTSKMKQLHRLYHCSLPCLIFLTALISDALGADVFFEDAIEDGAYLRREHCLTKPYHGEEYGEQPSN